MKRLPLPGVRWLTLCLCCAAGCSWNEAAYEKNLKDLQDAREELRKCNESRQGMETVVIDQHRQIQTLQRLGDKRLDYLFRVSRIELGSYTGGVSIQSKEGDDGIKVYLRPIDQDGSILKAPGDVKVQLFDLALGAKDNMIGEYVWPADKIGKQWFSDFMTYYYAFVCPWKNAPPQHEEITVRVEFTDYLTGKTFVEQKVVKIKRPPPSTASPRAPIAASQPQPAPAPAASVVPPPVPAPVVAPPAPAPAPAAPKTPPVEPTPVKVQALPPAAVIQAKQTVTPRPDLPETTPAKAPATPEATPPAPPAKIVSPVINTDPSPTRAPAAPPIILSQPPKALTETVEPKPAPAAPLPPKAQPPAPAKPEPVVEKPAAAAPPSPRPDATTPKIERPKKLLVIPDTPAAIAPAPEAPKAETPAAPAKVEPKVETPAPAKVEPKVESPAAAPAKVEPKALPPAPQGPAKLVEVKLSPAAPTRPAASQPAPTTAPAPTSATAPVLLDSLAPVESPKKTAASAPANAEPDLGGPPTFKPGK